MEPERPSQPSGTLFVVSLPIGNAEDITLRALRVLHEVCLIVAEDSRVVRTLLDSHRIATETVSMRPRKGAPARDAALACLHEGRDIAVVSDSGTPGVADPGLNLIQAAIQQGHRVTVVPGPTAFLAALLLSGMSVTPFSFLGFPPRSEPKRAAFFARLAACRHTVLLYESPRYLRSTLTELANRLEDSRKIVVACDLTHTHERIFRGTILTALTKYSGAGHEGAYTVVVSGDSSPVT